jgi:hypothetical protein
VQEGEEACIRVTGSCGFYELADSLEPVLESVAAQGEGNVLLDLGELRGLTTQISNLLLPWAERLENLGRRLRVRCGEREVRLLTRIGLTALVEVERAAEDGSHT